jgi:hypothetical protein
MLVVALIVAGSAARIAAFGSNDRVTTDEHGYVGNTNHLLGYRYPLSLKWAPGTPAMFAMATRLESWKLLHDEAGVATPAQHAQFAVEVITLAVVAAIAWYLAGGIAAVLAVGLTATYKPLVLVTATFLSEPLGALASIGLLVSVAYARRRSGRLLALAGVAAGVGCLCREDLLPAVAALAVYLAWSERPRWRRGLQRGALYLGCAAVTLTPWCIYASLRAGELVPVTASGPNALFIGTYLPADGRQDATIKAFAPAACQARPQACRGRSYYASGPMFLLLQDRYRRSDPATSLSGAARKAALHNLRVYALGRPLEFAGMLARKFARNWQPWGGVNARAHRVVWQHWLYILVAAVGLFGGALVSTRWSLRAAALTILILSATNTLFVAQARVNVRLDPLLFLFGACGLVSLARWGLERCRAMRPRRGSQPPPGTASPGPTVCRRDPACQPARMGGVLRSPGST